MREMLDLPKKIIQVLRQFESEFSERIWEWAKVLLVGAILSPGKRTVTEALRVMGLHNEVQFQNYHRVLNRAKWSSRALSRILLHLLVKIFVPADAPIVVGIDETIERRRGAKIAAKGIYRDPVRSSKAFFVKTSGLRWVSMMLLTPIRLRPAGLGLALFHSPGSFGALQPAAPTATQEIDRLGTTDDPPTATLAPGSVSRGGGRQQLCGARTARLRCRVEAACGGYHALALGCGSL